MTPEEKNTRVVQIGSAVSSAGMVAGLIYAFKKDKGFWGYVGYGLLFSTIGYTVGALPAFIFIKETKATDDKKTETTTTTTTTVKEPVVKHTIVAISKEKANEIFGFWLKKKKEMETAKYSDGGFLANAVLDSLKKSLESGGWKIDDNKLVKI